MYFNTQKGKKNEELNKEEETLNGYFCDLVWKWIHFVRRKKKYQNGFAELMDYLQYVLMDVEYNRKDYELHVILLEE